MGHSGSDDSVSMEFEEGGDRQEATKKVLLLLAGLYGCFSNDPCRIQVRFFNGNEKLSAEDLTTKDKIDEKIEEHQFNGLTLIGTSLIQKILKPFVYDREHGKRTVGKLERPLLVLVITDGAVNPPPP